MSGREVSLAGADHDILVVTCQDMDCAVATVGIEIGGLVRNRILAAKFILNGVECVYHIFHLVREECASASFFRELFEQLVSASLHIAVVGADGINGYFGATRGFNCFLAGYAALVIFAIADKNNDATNRPIGMNAR